VAVVVAAFVDLPNALDAQGLVLERVQPAALGVGEGLRGRFAGRGGAGGHDAVANG
jgi:hypothetical protein